MWWWWVLNMTDSWGTSISIGKKMIKDVKTNDQCEVFVYLFISCNVRVFRIILLAVEFYRSLKLGFVIVVHKINCLVLSIFDVLPLWHC